MSNTSDKLREMNSTDALREFAERYKNGGYRIVNDYAGNKTMQHYDNKDELLSDLTALISEHHVSKKAYDTVKEHYQGVLYANDIEKDYIDKYYYPKEFVEWKDKNTLSDKISRTEVRYFLKDMDAPLDWMTLDEVYNYWTNNIKQ